MVQPVTGDSILIFDPGLRRTTLMSLDGSHYESAVLAPRRSEANPLGLHTVVGRFRDGTVLAEGVEVVPAAGIVVPQSRVARLNPRLEDAVAVGEFPGSHMAFAPSASGGLMFWDPMFGRRTFYLVDGDGFYVAHSEHWEIRRYDSGGNLHFIVRSTSEPHGLTNRDFDWLLDSIAATRRGERRSIVFVPVAKSGCTPRYPPSPPCCWMQRAISGWKSTHHLAGRGADGPCSVATAPCAPSLSLLRGPGCWPWAAGVCWYFTGCRMGRNRSCNTD